MQMGNKVWLLLLGVLAVTPAQAELYRYLNRQGVVVLDRQGVPPEYVGNGYEVIDEEGRVLRVVPPAPSAEELRRRVAAQRQARADAQLRRLYPRVADLEVARGHQLRDLDGLIAVARGNLHAVQQRALGLERQAAEHQRASQPLPAALLQQLEGLRGEQHQAEAELQRLQGLRQRSEASFAADRLRLIEILGREP
ncbi:DUF4124 domain-containing protein [Pseudomonas sp. MAP12]|uniref:DUF4124 domain-containing protein n=1 Tax=Geopseudomonas aromaticivorans TaxID=2849492 RepID=A0ABS6MSW6_9GAMM|nr:DUF4124 domain-containing protein [Pseudomonas aromaticivorans]MBV2131893.1 DUF4124 domain-containing protein [Pseudomonas aromaticivorans]